MTTIQWLAKEHELLIRQQLQMARQSLLPSSTEDEELVRRAVFAVRNKSIVFERYISRAEMLYITVQDVRPAMVEINFLQKTVACSCPEKQICRHKLAVLLSLYQYFESVQDWAAEWRSSSNTQLKSLAMTRTPDSWIQMIDEVLGKIVVPNQKLETYMLLFVHDDSMQKLLRMMPLEREWQPLFKLFMETALLQRIWHHLNATDSDVHSGMFHHFVERSTEQITTNIHDLVKQSRLFATDPFYDALQNIVRTLAVECSGAFAKRLDIYRLFWGNLLYEKSRREQELAVLEGLDDTIVGQDVDLFALQSVFYILLHKLEQLQQLEEHVHPLNVASYYELASLAKRVGEWQAAQCIIRSILPNLKLYLNNWLTPPKRVAFIKNFHMLLDGIPLSEQEQMALYVAMGKFGLQPFSDYLIQQKRFVEWAALHQLNPSSISFLDMCGLKEVADSEPSAVLPLLHVYAMVEVHERSRANYKQAVRIWKRMKTAAKKAGKTTFFTTYMHTIRAQHKRLRALMEEIEKGNLLA